MADPRPADLPSEGPTGNPGRTTPGRPAAAPPERRRGRWVAILTGSLSILIGVLYLLLITVLDSRGPMRPPPPEALGVVPAAAAAAAGPAVAAPGPPPG